jgi:hypothetical protein
MKITMVKKIRDDGKECRKCQEVTQRLKENDEWTYIDRVVWADVNNPESEGYKLAEKYGLDIAPFFLVDDGKGVKIYKTYLELKRDVFNKEPEAEDIEIEEKRKPKTDPDEELYWL